MKTKTAWNWQKGLISKRLSRCEMDQNETIIEYKMASAIFDKIYGSAKHFNKSYNAQKNNQNILKNGSKLS